MSAGVFHLLFIAHIFPFSFLLLAHLLAYTETASYTCSVDGETLLTDKALAIATSNCYLLPT